MKKGLIASIDQGTSSTRVVVYDAELRAVRSASRGLKTLAPQPGWLQMDASDILASVDACLEEACSGLDVALVGITNQRETTVALDTVTGRALAPAILWSDTRTTGIVEGWRSNPRLSNVSGLPFSPYFSASKMAWLLEHEVSVRSAAAEGRLAFATVDALVVRHLTGSLRTDGTNASRTMLMDLATQTWDRSSIEFCGLSKCQFPEIRPSIGDFGVINRPGACLGARVTGVLGDQQAALLGQGCTRPGESKCTFGTGAFLLQHCGSVPPKQSSGLISTVALHKAAGVATYAVEGSVGAAGSVVSWLRDGLGVLSGPGELDAVASSVASTGGVTVVPAFGGLLAPLWRPDARACVLGLSLSSSRAHLVRAALLGIAHSVADVETAMSRSRPDHDHANPARVLMVDGGLAASRVLMQLVADCTGRPVAAARDVEATARGAAIAAGAGAGWWDADERARVGAEAQHAVHPQNDAQTRHQEREEWSKSLQKALP